VNELELIFQHYACDMCGAQQGEQCVTFIGNPAPASHHARWKDAVKDGALPMLSTPNGIVHTDRAQQILQGRM
jgi:hypothetical protein